MVGELGEDLVADAVAVDVVDALEVVDVEHHDADGLVRRGRVRELAAEPLVEVAVVEEAGQRVRLRLELEPRADVRVVERERGGVAEADASSNSSSVNARVLALAVDVERALEAPRATSGTTISASGSIGVPGTKRTRGSRCAWFESTGSRCSHRPAGDALAEREAASLITSRPTSSGRQHRVELALDLVGLVDVHVVVRDQLGERVRDAVEERVEALLGEHVVEDVREPAVRLDEAARPRAASAAGIRRDEAHAARGSACRWRAGSSGRSGSITPEVRALAAGNPLRRGSRGAPIGMMCAVPAVTLDDARRAALGGLIDHAALFPPASMPMVDALAEDARVRAAPEAWLVRRFVVPASRLDELGDAQLPLSVVLDAPYDGGDARVEAVEARPGADLDAVVGLAPEVYVELPADLERLSGARPAREGALRRRGRAVGRGAGRRHPELSRARTAVQGDRRPAPRRASRAEHGFLNLLAAAVFGDEEAALWRDIRARSRSTARRSAGATDARTAAEVATVRERLFVGFGSCSVAEPVDELRALGIL